MAFPVHHHYVNRTGECVPLCGADILFDKEDKYFASIWLAVWSILCFISTTFTLITFLLDTSRFLYPEKCIVFLNLSYNILRWSQFLLPPKIIFLSKFGIPDKTGCWSRGCFLHDSPWRSESASEGGSDTNSSLHCGLHSSLLCNSLICHLVVYHNNYLGCHGVLFLGSTGGLNQLGTVKH